VTSNHGTVTSNDGVIACGPTCSHDYAYQSSMMLTATPDSSYKFDHWSGGPCDQSTTPTCTVTMQAAPLTIQANYQSTD
jgi:hypothetical protein